MNPDKPLYCLSNPVDFHEINQIKINKNSPSSDSYLYKYCGLDVAILAINQEKTKLKLRFTEPVFWKDPVESQIYTAEFPDRIKDKAQKVFACCVTTNRLSEAAWITYGYDKTGIGARCVKFSLNALALRNALTKAASDKGYTLYEGDVEYVDSKNLNRINDPQSDIYRRFITENFTVETFLEMLLLKRNAFSYEKETRFFLVKKDAANSNRTKKRDVKKKVEGKHFVDIEIDIETVVNKVYYSESCDNAEIKVLREYYDEKVEASTLYKARKILVISQDVD